MTLLTSLTFLLTPVQQHEIAIAARLLEQGAIRRGNGHPRIRPERVAGDKGYALRKYNNSCPARYSDGDPEEEERICDRTL